jgi:adenosylcobinamide-GDP ribazoletransferase
MKLAARSPSGSRDSSWRAAVSMFTVIPAGGPLTIGAQTASRITMWLPAVAALLAAPAAGIMLAVEAGGDSVPRRLLGATLAIAALALLTGGLHLDGLADTADGLGSRRPAKEALDIMRRSDTGPMGVAALTLTLLVQVTSLASLRPGWLSAAALSTAVITSRVAVLAGSGSPAARPGGFGALIAGTTTRGARWTAAVVLLAIVGAVAAAAGGAPLAARGLAAAVSGLAVAAVVRRAACRRLGGMTGDVFGALIELSEATVLLVLVLSG